MSRLKTLQDKVEYCLEKYPICRNDDKILIPTVYKLFYDFDVTVHTAKDLLLDKNLPSFETITRCRRKIQEDRLDLQATNTARRQRSDMKIEIERYVRGKY